MWVETPEASNDVAKFVFGSDDPMPLRELAQSFLAIDRLFARASPSGARLAITEMRRGDRLGVDEVALGRLDERLDRRKQPASSS